MKIRGSKTGGEAGDYFEKIREDSRLKMINQSLITNEDDFLALEQEWKALLPQTRADNIFLTWEWVSTWWKVFGEGKQPHILTFRDETRLVGILPCYIRNRPLLRLAKIRELRFIGTGESVRSEYLDLICLPGHREECLELLEGFLSRDRDWDIAVFTDLPEDSLLGSFLDDRFPAREIINREPCYFVKVPAKFETYLKGIDSRMRRNIRNRRRNLERDFRVEYHRLNREENLDEWMEEFKRLHAARLEERGLPSKFADPIYQRFHDRLSRIFYDSGLLFAADLRLDGKTVAARYNFNYRGKVYDYQTGFEPKFGRQGVMQALISYMIEDCGREEIGKFDFLAGSENYKRHFSNSQTTISSHRIINNTFQGQLYGSAHRLKSRIRKKSG